MIREFPLKEDIDFAPVPDVTTVGNLDVEVSLTSSMILKIKLL